MIDPSTKLDSAIDIFGVELIEKCPRRSRRRPTVGRRAEHPSSIAASIRALRENRNRNLSSSSERVTGIADSSLKKKTDNNNSNNNKKKP